MSEASRGAAAQSMTKTYWLWAQSPLEEMKYLLKCILPFLRYGVEGKRGAEFCHLTRNASLLADLFIFYFTKI